MAIRVRIVDGIMVALCAARSVPKEGDIYLDDAIHGALTEKAMRDWYEENGFSDYGKGAINSELYTRTCEIVDREESNNPNREDWDKTFGNPEWWGNQPL
jgi:hypothetical protein